MALFRKKPVVIEAVETSCVIAVGKHTWHSLPEWFRQAHLNGAIEVQPDHINIKTLEGTMRAEPSDFIIRGIKGELYPCKPDIFAQTYEAAE
jgi:hypothetical protein